jgi:chitosanase
MNISSEIKQKIVNILNVFETGKANGDYQNISIYRDGPLVDGKQIKQITYGRSQTTEYGNLKKLLTMYINNNGIYASQFTPFIDKIGGSNPSLCTDVTFINLLKDAANNDDVMHQTQDDFFDTCYYQPAYNWAESHGFTYALSLLVIYDSYIHSGGILDFLRNKFPETPPVKGGDEKTWITKYVDTRDNWLRNHSNPILQRTVYRTECLKKQISNDNWDLLLDVNANRVIIK